jgi:uncharacterized protein
MRITKEQARSFLLHKQFLSPPQSLPLSKGIETVFSKLRLIQYDPLNPCGRNTDLVLQARIKDYHPDAYYKWLYIDKNGIECYDKELCIIPIEDFPLITHRQLRSESYGYRGDFIKEHKFEIESLLDYIEKNGPISSADVPEQKQVIGEWTENARFGRVALDTLWRIGRLVVVKRQNGRKYYDLPSRFHSSLVSSESGVLLKEHVVRRISSIGMLIRNKSTGGWQGFGEAKALNTLIDLMIREGDLVEVMIEECKTPYLLPKNDLPILKHIAPIELKDTTAVFIAPLDNLIWNRQMIRELFHFDYLWEVYTPVAKRKYGYYTLPILYGDRFIGRIEPVFHRQENVLEIRGFWKEEGLDWSLKKTEAIQKAIIVFKNYLKADQIKASSFFG